MACTYVYIRAIAEVSERWPWPEKSVWFLIGHITCFLNTTKTKNNFQTRRFFFHLTTQSRWPEMSAQRNSFCNLWAVWSDNCGETQRHSTKLDLSGKGAQKNGASFPHSRHKHLGRAQMWSLTRSCWPWAPEKWRHNSAIKDSESPSQTFLLYCRLIPSPWVETCALSWAESKAGGGSRI